MRLTIAYSTIKERNLVLINNVTHQRENLIRATHSTTLNKGCGEGGQGGSVQKAFTGFVLHTWLTKSACIQ